ncbi:serine/threonine-protein kinase 36-like isoform X1 [Acipenser ruthenus]|uniref:serine/threonine-protein kinase 36-like isoform X1 n=1 Tax=Acipenser ruthenus TaxID=7906 RepID=UPI00274245AB|nr:serine/threonine-protein kinase 36-like isoform X1 [Acipenser ruthenus]
MEKYHVLEVVGEGSFGRVYKGRRKFSGQVVALKFIPKVGRSEKELRSLKREIEIMRGLMHPNIVLLLDSFETDREVVVVTEYAEGELFQILEDDGNLPESRVREIACQLVSALYYLHSHRILHRDMKPQNILLGKGGVVKLCDFGFARAMSVSTMVLTSIKGTPLYMAPELVEEKPYDHTADLWSLGCILYELHTGTPPFYTNSIFQLVKLIVRDPVKWPDNMSPPCTSFLKGLLMKDPQKRLSWPCLFEHPFVADGVFIVSDDKTDSPLTVQPSSDLLALKLRQATEKASPHTGEGRIVRKAREHMEQAKKQRQEPTTGVVSEQARPTPDWTAEQKAALPQANRDGQISRDYAREFPSVEVGGRQVMKNEELRTSLQTVQLESEEVDSDEEWQRLVKTTEPGSPATLPSDPDFVSRLKERLQGARVQLLDGMLEGACRLRPPLRVLGNLLTVNSDPKLLGHLAQEINIPHFLLELIGSILENQTVVQQPWAVAVLGDLMAVLGVYWKNDLNWEMQGERLEDAGKLFTVILLHPDLTPLTPMAGTLLAQLTLHGVSVELRPDVFLTAMEQALASAAELSLSPPAGWGLFDGLLTLLYQALSEGDGSTASQFMDSALWRFLWLRVGVALEEGRPHWDCFSHNGLQVFLSLALFLFTREPYRCLPLLANHNADCVLTLARLLTADCFLLKDGACNESTARSPSDSSSSSSSSLSVMTCHLLCFPFALDITEDTVDEILQSYHSCDIVPRLLQLCLLLPLPLLELPLALLCRLLLSDPQYSIPRFIAEAESCSFFSLTTASEEAKIHKRDNNEGSQKKNSKLTNTDDSRSLSQSENRTASSLLASFLQSESLFSSAVELISLLSHAARCSVSPPFPLCFDPALVRKVLNHPDDRIRAATCGLLGNVRPPNYDRPSLLLFQDLIGKLRDQSMQVRRAACRAVGNWAGLIVPNVVPRGVDKEERAKEGEVSNANKENEKAGSRGARTRGTIQSGETKRKGGRDVTPKMEESVGKKNKGAGFQKIGVLPSNKMKEAGLQNKEDGKGVGHAQNWEELTQGAVPVLLPLLTDSDPVIRQRCCSALGNVGVSGGGGAALLQCDGPRLLLERACTDSRHAVRQAAISALRALSQQEALRQVLVSLDASEKLRTVSQHAPRQCHCHWLISKLRPTASA